VEGGALDTVVPITSRDEIGRLTQSFNSMVGELRVTAQIRETFGKYVDPRIVAGLIDRPELTDPKGSRREMTILFCDMKDFTTFSEGMTPAALVTVLNRYLTVMSDPVRRHNGIIDSISVMASWRSGVRLSPAPMNRPVSLASLRSISSLALPHFVPSCLISSASNEAFRKSTCASALPPAT
jgi:adenylate cyclase